MEELTVRNGLIVTPTGTFRGGLSASKGCITMIGVDSSLPKGKEEVDANGKIILPGMIDPHLHLGYPTRPGKGEQVFAIDFETESQAAAASGVTTIITTASFWGATSKSNQPCIKRAKEIGHDVSMVDFKLTAYVLNPLHIAELGEVFEQGITSFKFLTAYRGEEAKQVGIGDVTWGLVYNGFEAISRLPKPALAMLHAENVDLIEVFSERIRSTGKNDLASWTDSRPGICEAIDILISGTIARELGLPLYYPHIGSSDAIEAITLIRDAGATIYVETCPSYLTFTKDSPLGALGKVNPPLRSSEDIEDLWTATSCGFFDTIGTDHVVTSSAMQSTDNVWDSTPGFASLGMPLPVLITYGVDKGRLSWQQVAELCSENVARIFGIYPRKGILSPGSDADFIIVDPDIMWKVDHRDWLTASEFCIFDGMDMKGKVLHTYVRGQKVGENMRPVGQKSIGRFIEPVL